MKVTFHAELIQVEGRTLTFRVRADDEKETVGEGTHQRAVIDVARFQARVRAKTASST
jgi:fluoroacetyl-CoA thioesterase